MNSKLLAALAMMALVAVAFVSVGMAYTASTENSGNTLTSEYVVLEQTKYTFTDDTLQFDTVTNEMGTYYQLRYATELIPIDGKMYYGVQVGESDTLKSTVVGNPSLTKLDVTVNTLNLAESIFTDYSDIYDWRYILKISSQNGSVVQYAYYDGHTSDEDLIIWKVFDPNSPVLTTGVSDYTRIVGSWNVWEEGISYNVSAADATGTNEFIVLTNSAYNVPAGISVIKITNSGIVLETGKEIGYKITGMLWGTTSKSDYSITDNDVKNGYVVVVDNGYTGLTGYKVLKISENGNVTLDNGKSVGDRITGNWKLWGVNSVYNVIDGDKYGSDTSDFIVLIGEGQTCLSRYTVVKITNNGVTFETNKNAGDTIKGSWKLWNTTSKMDYKIVPSDSRNKIIVLVDAAYSTTLTGHTIIEIPNKTAITINAGETYTTSLYFAGPGETVNDSSSVRGAGKVAKVRSTEEGYTTTISPIWAPSSDGDYSSTIHSGYPAGATDISGKPLKDQSRSLYFTKGTNLMLPEAQFGEEIKVGSDVYVFAGWYNAEKNKTYSPRSTFVMTEDMEFTAQWLKKENATVINFNVNTAKITGKASGDTVYGKWMSVSQETAGNYSLSSPATSDIISIGGKDYILLINEGVPASAISNYTVVMVRSNGAVVFESGMTASDTISGNWISHDQNVAGSYSLESHAANDKISIGGKDYIVIVDADYTLSATYGVITIDGWTGFMNDDYISRGGHYYLPPNEFDRTGYRFLGWTVDDPMDSSTEPLPPVTYNKIPSSVESVTLYANWEVWTPSSPYEKIIFHGDISFSDRAFTVYTDSSGKYIMPDCMFGPEYELPDDTKGWKFIGWKIKTADRYGYTVAQSSSMPVGKDSDYIIKNGTIKFIYDSEEQSS